MRTTLDSVDEGFIVLDGEYRHGFGRTKGL